MFWMNSWCFIYQALGQENISQGTGKQLVEFTNLLQKIMSNMGTYKEKSVFITSFLNVWEENILSLEEEMQGDTGMRLRYLDTYL